MDKVSDPVKKTKLLTEDDIENFKKTNCGNY